MELANSKENVFFSINKSNKYCMEDFDIVGTQGLNNVLIITNEIKEGATILDVGCSYGRIGKELIKKKCTIFGIEIDSIAAEMAKNNEYNDVFLHNIEDFNSSEYKKMCETIGNVDVVIFSDVFEHLVDPTKVLIEYSKFLKSDGILLISVPNIAHMDIILHLLDGEFNYGDMGILDNTHLKFFTKKSFVQWINLINSSFDDIQFDCEFLGSTFYNSEYMEKIKVEFPKLYNVMSQNSNYNGLQMMFKLKKINKMRVPKNLFELLSKKEIELTNLIGDIVEGRNINIDLLPNMNYGEKLWLNQRIKELNDGLEWYIRQDKERQNYVEDLEKQIEVQKKGLEWHQGQDKERQSYIEDLEKQIEVQKKGLEWHQGQDKERQDYIEGLEKQIEVQKKGLEWHQGQDKERQDYIEGLEKQIEVLKNGLEWHQEQDKERQDYIESIEKQIDVLKMGLEWHQNQDKVLHEYITLLEKNLENEKNNNNELQSKLFTIENSVSWKVTKFLR